MAVSREPLHPANNVTEHMALNLRQAMFLAAGWSESQKPGRFGIRVYLFQGVRSGAFVIERNRAKRFSKPGYKTVATFMHGEVESLYIEPHIERDIFPPDCPRKVTKDAY